MKEKKVSLEYIDKVNFNKMGMEFINGVVYLIR